MSDRLCGSTDTADGKPCRNKAESCPFREHRRQPSAATAPLSAADIEPGELLGFSADADFLGRADALPGVESGAPGMAGHPREFADLLDKAVAATGVDGMNLVRDYWLTFCLHGIASAGGPEGEIAKGQGRRATPLAKTAFAGGTSLVSAWDITRRYSEDLDMLALMVDPSASTSAFKRPLSVVTRWAVEAIGLEKEAVTVRQMSNVGHRRTLLDMGGTPQFLKLETTVETYGDGLCEQREVTSLMGRFAAPEQLKEYPELGRFEMLCVTPAYTAANKLDALHRRAETGDLRGLIIRGRDLYDLAAIADSDHGSAARAAIPQLAGRAAQSSGTRETIPRPAHGYANSIMFKSGSETHAALRDGYEQTAHLVWGDFPPFDEAVELAASLDSHKSRA
ncbi:nucleotidyl transferase AbiEii/AbiGii toxin family protein [Candidatus Poriferisocius sp.]|uniref:nucleotidyl transferase AbiEii/AbiGii toxin family protein n=1 Tax=Candidatus Poriferisocius sp. TaxID=3101276 RepID=UPI003B01997E